MSMENIKRTGLASRLVETRPCRYMCMWIAYETVGKPRIQRNLENVNYIFKTLRTSSFARSSLTAVYKEGDHGGLGDHLDSAPHGHVPYSFTTLSFSTAFGQLF